MGAPVWLAPSFQNGLRESDAEGGVCSRSRPRAQPDGCGVSVVSVPGHHTVVRVGIIGLGRWGRELADRFARRADLVICGNRQDPAGREWLRTRHPDVRFGVGADEILSTGEIDAVVIATPVSTHAGIALRALEMGKHVFVEKPLATSVAEAQRLVAAARAADRRLFVGHTFLFHPVFLRLARLTEADPVQHLWSCWRKLGTFDEDLIWNLLSHEAAIALRVFLDRPGDACLIEQRSAHTRLDFLAARLSFPGDRFAHMTIDRCAPSTGRSVTAVTRSGRVYCWDGDALYRLTEDAVFDPIDLEDVQDALSHEVETFLQSVADGRPTMSDGEFGLDVVAVLAQLDTQVHRP